MIRVGLRSFFTAMREFRLKEKQRPDVRVREDRPVQVPFVLMADTVLMANTVMADYKITYEDGMGTTITLKEKTRPMLTVMREEDYVILNRKYDITFTITEDSTPLEDVRVVIDGVEKFTSALGVAVFRLKNGTYTYQLTKTGYITVTDTVTVNSADVSNPDTMEEDIPDPIQVLVDEYKAYVTSQSGTIGVSDAVLYTAYDRYVTEGIINNTGTRLKEAHVYGIYGFLKDGGNLCSKYWGIIKNGVGAYPEYTSANPFYPLYENDAFTMYHTGAQKAITGPSTGFRKKSFYIEMDMHTIWVTAGCEWAKTIGDHLLCRLNGTGRATILTYNPSNTRNSSNNFLPDNYQLTRIELIRFNDGADKVTIKLYQNGVLFQTLADVEWTSDFNNVVISQFGSTAGGATFKLKTVTIAEL
jgi:hypothetical protein